MSEIKTNDEVKSDLKQAIKELLESLEFCKSTNAVRSKYYFGLKLCLVDRESSCEEEAKVKFLISQASAFDKDQERDLESILDQSIQIFAGYGNTIDPSAINTALLPVHSQLTKLCKHQNNIYYNQLAESCSEWTI
jgi:hypothetical protein